MLHLEKIKQQYENKIFHSKKNTPFSISIEKKEFESGSDIWDYYVIEAKNDKNDKIGAVKIAILEKDKFQKYLGDILKYAQFRGEHLNVYTPPHHPRFKRLYNEPLNDSKTLEGKKNILRVLKRNLTEEQINQYSETEVKELFDKEVQHLKYKYKRNYKMFKDYHLEKPEVHYSSVESEYQGEGIGKTLYKAASEMLGQNGYKLFQSNTISVQASNLWDNWKENLNTDPKSGRKIIDKTHLKYKITKKNKP